MSDPRRIAVFPLEEGGIRLEWWSKDGHDCSIDIEEGFFHVSYKGSDSDDAFDVKSDEFLSKSQEWKIELLRKMFAK